MINLHVMEYGSGAAAFIEGAQLPSTHRWRRPATSISSTFTCAALLLYLLVSVARVPAATALQAGSFTRCLRNALQRFGVTPSAQELRLQMLLPFGPVLVTNAACFEQACLAAEPLQLAHVAEANGVSAEYLALKPNAWNNVIARRYTRERMQHTLDEGGVVMAEGDWDIGGPMRAWGVLTDVSGPVLSGEVDRVAATLPGSPLTLVLLTPTNSSLAPRILARTLLRSAILHVHGSAAQSQRSAVLRGNDALASLGLAAIRTPWCPACGDASPRCISRVLHRWADDTVLVTAFLASVRTDLAAPRAALLDEASATYLALHTQLVALARAAAAISRTHDGAQQYALGLQIAALAQPASEAAIRLGRALDLPTPAAFIERPRLPPATSSERHVLRALPLFRDMQGGDDDFFCALYVVNYVAGTRDPILWLKGLTAEPFVCPPAPPRSERTLAREIFLVAGYAPEFYFCPTNAPPNALDMFRRAIVDAINRGVPVMARGLDQPRNWSVIVGYKDCGRILLARTPSDAKRDFCETPRLPTECFVPARELPRLTDRQLLQRALRRAVAQYGPLSGLRGTHGIPALRQWHIDIQEAALTRELPPWTFARDSGRNWLDWLNRRRDAYRFLQLAVRRVPDALADVVYTINVLVQQVNALNAAQADKIVLHEVGGVIMPPDWTNTAATAQADLMASLISNEVRIATVLRDILDAYTRAERESGLDTQNKKKKPGATSQ